MKLNYDKYQDKILVNKLLIEIAKIKSTGGHIEIMLIIEIELTRGQIDYKNEIGIMLIIEMAKKKLTGGHIEFIVFM